MLGTEPCLDPQGFASLPTNERKKRAQHHRRTDVDERQRAIASVKEVNGFCRKSRHGGKCSQHTGCNDQGYIA